MNTMNVSIARRVRAFLCLQIDAIYQLIGVLCQSPQLLFLNTCNTWTASAAKDD